MLQTYANVLRTPTIGNDAREWYPNANAIASHYGRLYGLTVNQSAGVIAAYSTNRQWAVNVRTAERAMQGNHSHYGFIVDKCDRILQTDSPEEIMEILHGDKIKRFFHNIIKPYDSPYATIDRHMVQPLGLSVKQLPCKYGHALTVYERIEESVIALADSIGEPIPATQAALWIAIRGTGE